MATTAINNGSARPVRRRRWGVWLLRGVGGLVAVLVGLALAGLVYEAVADTQDAQAYPAPGQLVDIGGRRLHLLCQGTGTPTVILESGLLSTSSLWAWIQPTVAGTTRVCAYDRAGNGWSDSGPAPRDARQIAADLHLLLARAGIAGPYVLVGHSYGGLYMRVFASTYPDEVAGVALIDSSHPDQWTTSPAAQANYQSTAQQAQVSSLLCRLGVARLFHVIAAPTDLPARQQAELQAFNNSARLGETFNAEFSASEAMMADVRGAPALGARPLYVLTATDHGAPAQEADWQRFQVALAALSSNSRHQVLTGASHLSLLTRPADAAQTSAAILQVVAAVRTGQPLVPGR